MQRLTENNLICLVVIVYICWVWDFGRFGGAEVGLYLGRGNIFTGCMRDWHYQRSIEGAELILVVP